MRVLLINPWAGEVFPTPAIGYLQSVLKANGVDVTATDLLYGSDDYDLVAVTFHSFSVKHAQKIREHYKGRLICGGHHPSALPQQMLSIGYDQVIIGEGERAIMEVVNGNTSQIIKGEISEIDSIPFPDYSGLNFWGTMGIPVISSRGCVYKCNFCASTSFWGHKYRFRSADNVLKELSLRIEQGFKSWMFESDTFTQHRQTTMDICNNLTGEYLWQCASRADVLDEDLCNALYKAGCRTVWIGVESLSQESLDRCNKNTTVNKMITGIKNAEKAGLNTVNQFIVGIPGDTLSNIIETRQRIKESKIKSHSANIIWLLPHTEAYKRAKNQGFDDIEYLNNGCPYYTYEQSLETLKYWASLI